MILSNSPQNQAILSNVGEIGEFKIRHSAKAFSILSSGLYANKIRAIVRELSCNAVDSHRAAGCENTPFDVHLPNQLEPWFAIRDYGVGLDHEQVINLYTTYFESTKTSSNDFIGALGLGSKSPFSYTDNFTVTATKQGRRGIYTAFINEQGVPSIALMLAEETNEPNGVEVKFSVNSSQDFYKFQQEAQYVYKYFAHKPVVNGVKDFVFEVIDYESRDIIPGVHQYRASRQSMAVMGNISYPINIPEADKSLGDLRDLLNCGLEIHFDIGELDFQASREGLSYIPQTIESIKRKLTALNATLSIKLKQEANLLDNLWDRALFLAKRKNNHLWKVAAQEYGKLPTYDPTALSCLVKQRVTEDDLIKFNIKISSLRKERGVMTLHPIKPDVEVNNDITRVVYGFAVSVDEHFVVNDIKRGYKERTKFNYRKLKMTNSYSLHVHMMEAIDSTKPMQLDKFFAAINCPPSSQIFSASQLEPKPSTSDNKSNRASVMKLVSSRRGHHTNWVWNAAGTVADLDQSKTYYYVAMDLWTPIGIPVGDVREFLNLLRDSGVFSLELYGVRRKDLDAVAKLPNWVEINSHVKKQLASNDVNSIMGIVKDNINFTELFKHASHSVNKESPYYKLWIELKDVGTIKSHIRPYLSKLYTLYNVKMGTVDPTVVVKGYQSRADEIRARYPLLSHLSYGVNSQAVVDYINMIEQIKSNNKETSNA